MQAARLGRGVAVAAFGRQIGGMSASGLGATDTGNIGAIGGLAREFYRRAGARSHAAALGRAVFEGLHVTPAG